jgi:hypothetical protein
MFSCNGEGDEGNHMALVALAGAVTPEWKVHFLVFWITIPWMMFRKHIMLPSSG